MLAGPIGREWHVRNRLRHQVKQAGWSCDAVCDEVLHEGSGSRAARAEEGNLDGRGLESECGSSRETATTLQRDHEVDAVCSNGRHCVQRRQTTRIDAVIARLAQHPGPHRPSGLPQEGCLLGLCRCALRRDIRRLVRGSFHSGPDHDEDGSHRLAVASAEQEANLPAGFDVGKVGGQEADHEGRLRTGRARRGGRRSERAPPPSRLDELVDPRPSPPGRGGSIRARSNGAFVAFVACAACAACAAPNTVLRCLRLRRHSIIRNEQVHPRSLLVEHSARVVTFVGGVGAGPHCHCGPRGCSH
mmetsp:Transcript_12662/g.40451  ORF Transcript_12662/g.40451 Transcript_12662/m.40451 type:complete len:302 (-) Transcript_12662:799-1704(-)